MAMHKVDSLGYPVGRGRDDLDMGAFLNVRITRTAARLSVLFQREALRPNNLSLQEWRVLLNLAKLGNCHLRELSRISTVDPSHASRVTKALEERNLIRRFPDADDSRRMRLTVTVEGHAMIDQIWPIAIDLSARIEREVGVSDIAAMIRALDGVRSFANTAIQNDEP
jgi:DNA-binding MarR family transcriptional regulator